MPISYAAAGLGRSGPADPHLVSALQRDLRALGYLARGIDGEFGENTRLAVRRLQWDLLRNDGRSTGNDGAAPVAVRSYNRGVADVTGIVDDALANSIDAMLSDPAFPKLPFSADPVSANRRALAAIASSDSRVAPTPFVLAMLRQESRGEHFAVPRGADTDDFVIVGLDHSATAPDIITSRGYGIGQHTIFHHPPRAEEIVDFIDDPVRNVARAYQQLRAKLDGFVLGNTPGTQADDRIAEHPLLNLRLCRYPASSPRHMTGCRACATAAPRVDINPATPVFTGAAQTYGQASHYPNPVYDGVPDRAAFPCDWPYAVRRYNGSGPDSYNYQARILLNLLGSPDQAGMVA